jgi:hypothetical protein
VQGAGCRVQGAGFRVQGAGFRVQGARFKVQCSRFTVCVNCVGQQVPRCNGQRPSAVYFRGLGFRV